MSAPRAMQSPRAGRRADRDDEEELDQRALDLGIIRRLARYTRPYATKRNVLLALVLIRSIQLPVLGWVVGAVLSGPIADHDARGTWLGVLGFLALATLTEATFHFRMRYALELGEAVVHDLRNAIYAHLLRHAAGLLPGAHRAGGADHQPHHLRRGQHPRRRPGRGVLGGGAPGDDAGGGGADDLLRLAAVPGGAGDGAAAVAAAGALPPAADARPTGRCTRASPG